MPEGVCLPSLEFGKCLGKGRLPCHSGFTIRTLRYDNEVMNGREFVRRARSYARKTGQRFHFDPALGKGSHGRLYVGARFTTIQRGELSRGMLAAMLRQLRIDQGEF